MRFLALLSLSACLGLGLIKPSSAQEVTPDYDQLIAQAVELRNQGQMATAESMFRQAYDIASNKSEAAYLLGLVVAFQQRYQEAYDIIEEGLALYPQDLNLQLAKARVLSYQGMTSEAQELIRAILEDTPDNDEARNLSARIALYQQRPDYARTQFEALLQEQPQNLEAAIGLYDAQSALGQTLEAEETLKLAAQLAPGHIDVLSRQGNAELEQTLQDSISLGYSHSETSSQTQDWHERFAQYTKQYSRHTEQSFRISHFRRFGLTDTSISTDVLLRKLSANPIFISARYTPDAEFIARASLSAGTSFRLSEGTERIGTSIISPSIQISDYLSGTVKRVDLNLEHYLRNIDAWVSLGSGTVIDENNDRSNGFQVSAHWQFSARSRIGFAHYNGAETENSVTRKSRSNSAYLIYDLSSSLSTRWDLGRTYRSNSKPRSNFALTLQYKY